MRLIIITNSFLLHYHHKNNNNSLNDKYGKRNAQTQTHEKKLNFHFRISSNKTTLI